MPKSPKDQSRGKNKASGRDPHAEREASRYENPIASREMILELLAQQGPLDYRDLCKTLSIKGHERRDALRRRLRAMQRDGQVFCNRAEQYGVPEKMDLLRGRVEAHRDGYGFLILDGEDDIFLGESEMRQVFHGDEVLVRPSGHNRRGQVEGKIVEILHRATSQIVGRLNRESGLHFVVPDNPRIAQDILVDGDIQRSVSADLEIGDYVSIEIVDYPTRRSQARGKIVERLGAPMAPGLEIDLALRSHDIPHQWAGDVLNEAGKLGQEPKDADKKHRIDLRDLPLVTIDGEDARDFDDAVYCKKKRDGSFTLWVAIADVSHYVAIGSGLDRCAQERATSVYFPGRVVPMLPEAISNGLCSLKPEVDRLCMVCEMTISASGEMTAYQFYEAVMHSHARLTYTEVAEVLGLLEREPRAGLQKRVAPILPHLQQLHELYQVLRVARKKRGAIDFETTETQMVFNADRKIDNIVPIERNDAHKMIEECMLSANVATAEFLAEHQKPAPYRVHEGPRALKLENLRAYLGELGLGLRGGEKPSPSDYQQLMLEIEDRPDAHLIQTMMLRSLSQAVYQPDNQGHFGLAYDAYAHFTSPIRRYPDLLVHRAIRSVIRSKERTATVRRARGSKTLPVKESYPYSMADMLAAGEHCSMAERRADEATRDVEAWLKCEYLSERVGEAFTGIVAGVTNFGLFIELEGVYVEGLLHITSLGKDYFHFDAAKQRLIGERSSVVYHLGDAVPVVIAAVNLDTRKIDLTLQGVDEEDGGFTGKRRRKSGKGGKKGKQKNEKNAAKKVEGKATASKKKNRKKLQDNKAGASKKKKAKNTESKNIENKNIKNKNIKKKKSTKKQNANKKSAAKKKRS